MRRIELPRGWDLHVHFREGATMQQVAPHTARMFAGALAMPNTTIPIQTAEQAKRYAEEVCQDGKLPLDVRVAIKMLPSTTTQMIEEAKRAGVLAVKFYPLGRTTNAHDGLRLPLDRPDLLAAMQDQSMVLCLHGEHPDAEDLLEAEEMFLHELERIATQFPRLRIVFEHVSTRAAVDLIMSLPNNVAATITAHHLLLTSKDVMGPPFRPDDFCLPIAKHPSDREALWSAIESGSPKFFFGSDSAPHPTASKYAKCVNGGVYSAPVLLPFLVEAFDRRDDLHHLSPFIGTRGPRFYNLPRSAETVSLEERPFHVPTQEADLVPFQAGTVLQWSLI